MRDDVTDCDDLPLFLDSLINGGIAVDAAAVLGAVLAEVLRFGLLLLLLPLVPADDDVSCDAITRWELMGVLVIVGPSSSASDG